MYRSYNKIVNNFNRNIVDAFVDTRQRGNVVRLYNCNVYEIRTKINVRPNFRFMILHSVVCSEKTIIAQRI